MVRRVLVLLALLTSVPLKAEADPHFMRLPFNQDNVVLQQGWIYTTGGAHNGIDWQRNWVPFNVYAAHDGEATYVGGCGTNDPNCNGGWGNYVKIKKGISGVDYFSLYGHLQSSPLSPGVPTTVTAGQLIGVTGITGAANGVNHLHFEYHKGSFGTKRDPYDINSTASQYPPNNGQAQCGPNYAWEQCPPTFVPPPVYACAYQPPQEPAGQFNAVRGLLRQYTLRFKNESTDTWTKAAGPNHVELRSCSASGVETASFLNNPYDASLGWISSTITCNMQENTVAYGGTATFTFWGRVAWNASLGLQGVYFRPYHTTAGMLSGWGGAAFQPYVVKPKPFDFDGDGVSDVWDRTASGLLHLDFASNNLAGWDSTRSGYGGSSDTPAPADYDGDGKCDFAVLWNSDRTWRIDYAFDGFGSFVTPYLGGYGDATDYPCPCDYDGDGKADLSVRAANGQWKVDYSKNGFGAWDSLNPTAGLMYGGGYGVAYDRPAPADYDGDHKCDFAVLRNSDRKYLVDYAANGFGGWDELNLGGYGGFADYPCPADYDGDLKADIAVLNTGDGSYRIDFTGTPYLGQMFGSWDAILSGYGGTGDRPMPGDFDGDGRIDIGMYYPSVSRVCFDFWNYQGNTGWGDQFWCDQNNHPPYAPKAPEGRSSPLAFTVGPNRPNPFNPQTTIRYTLPSASRVTFQVFNVRGQRVATLVDAEQRPGPHEVVWNAKGFASGIYHYRLTAGSHRASGRMVLLK